MLTKESCEKRDGGVFEKSIRSLLGSVNGHANRGGEKRRTVKPPKRLGCLVYVPAVFTLITTIVFVIRVFENLFHDLLHLFDRRKKERKIEKRKKPQRSRC